MSGVLIKGGLVHYETLGRGKPIVFLHGWLGSWRYWVPVMDELSGDFRTYALDLWGFGDSDKTWERYDIQTYGELLLAFMDELGIWRVPLVGHTLGAAVAIQTALQHPDRVPKVMAVGLPLTAETIHRKLRTWAPNEILARCFWSRQRPYPEIEMSIAKIAPQAIARTVQAVAQLNVRLMLEEIDAPVLIVYGGKDVVIDPAQADELEDHLDGARAIVLPESHHFPMLDETARFARLLRDFMDIETPAELRELSVKQEWRRRTR
ncbi:MAG: alpha/beta fold hydrolase [Anaerolineae bacterium]